MKIPRPTIGLPLLAKELVEQSSRRRTYIVRVVYAMLLFIASFFAFYDVLDNLRADQFAALGHGKPMFDFLVGIQFFGVYLFMPAIACGVLTAEKERNSLGLLFLTRLGPATILFEKLLSRLVPMFSFLLLSLPLLAFAYSLGGITTAYLCSGVWLLAITAVQMCALAVMCSAYFRGTVGAFIGAYLTGLVILFGMPVCEVLGLINVTPGYFYRGGAVQVMQAQIPLFVQMLKAIGIVGDGREDVLFVFFGPYIFYEHAASNVSFVTVVIRSVPILLSTAYFLVLARVFIVWRAFVPSHNYVLALFRAFDRLFVRMNQNRVTRGIVLVRESTALPADAPVAWRETTKKSMGTVRYLFRMFVATEIPVVVICVLVVGVSYNSTRLEGVSVMLFVLWFIAVMLISVRATSLVSAERSHQTLDVLLTTPMSARDIVLQKYRGVRRLMFVLSVPFLTIFLFEASWKAEFWTGRYSGFYGGYGEKFSTLVYLAASVLSVAIYFPMIAWLSFLIGMVVRLQSRAIIVSLAIIVGWCTLPLGLLAFIQVFLFNGMFQRNEFEFLFLLSPASIIPINEFNAYREIADSSWTIVLINFLMYGTCLVVFRLLCLRLANRLLGRADD
jgi:hypothetical protein